MDINASRLLYYVSVIRANQTITRGSIGKPHPIRFAMWGSPAVVWRRALRASATGKGDAPTVLTTQPKGRRSELRRSNTTPQSNARCHRSPVDQRFEKSSIAIRQMRTA